MKLLPPFKGAVPNDVTQGFTPKQHAAVDISSSFGTPLVAPFRALIVRIVQGEHLDQTTNEVQNGCGLLMTSVEDPTYRVSYWHCEPVFPVSAGDIVEAGSIVAFMGNTGYVTGSGMIYTPEEREKEYLESTPSNLPKKGVHTHISMGIGTGLADSTTNVDYRDYVDWTAQIHYDLLTAIMVTLRKIGNIINNK